MDRKELIPHFYELTTTELKRKEGKLPSISPFYQILEQQGLKDENGIFVLPAPDFPLPKYHLHSSYWDRLSASPHQTIFRIKRASRYTEEPFSYSKFISIRYVYSGEVQMKTPTSQFTLRKNDLCLMNQNFTLSQALDHDEDVSFTLMMEKEYLKEKVLHAISEKNIITQIISDYVLDEDNPQRYILFHGGENDRISHIIEDMICEYMDPSPYGELLIDSYLTILLIEMLNSEYESADEGVSKNSLQLLDILSYIDRNYRTCDLNTLAEHFQYSSKYLSRFIKDKTGRNFKDIVAEKKMEELCILLCNSNASIQSIMEKCGFHNETYFYKMFQQKYHMTPKQYREKTTGG